MHILLTDISSCPRCGPDFGLILLVEEASDRVVQRGALACAHCREHYPIAQGTGDFTLGEISNFGPPGAAESALRLVALAGVTNPRSRLLVVGPAAAHAASLAALVPDVDVVVAGADATAREEPGVNRLAVSGRLPFYADCFGGVVLSGGAADMLLAEGARVLAPGGRLVLEPAPADAPERVPGAGLTILAAEGATLVAVRS